MNNRSGLMTFFLFLFFIVLLTLQLMAMFQSDRLYERLNVLIDTVSSRYSVSQTVGRQDDSESKYPGDSGDWLIRCIQAEPSTLNCLSESSSWGTRWMVSGSIFESMVGYKSDSFEYEGNLAEEFSISDDGLEIYFRLKDNIWFSDGYPVTTDDVIFTFETIMDPNIDIASYANYFRDVDRYEKINDKEIKFYMKNVYFQSLGFLGGIPIHPKHIYGYDKPQEFNSRTSNPVGSGPYVFEKWDVGQQVVLKRNENYWGDKPKINKLVFRFITNDSAALQALQSGEIDYLRPLPQQFSEKSNDEIFRKNFYCLSYWDAGNTGYFWIGWNQKRPFFADRKVRLAMTHIIDRQAIKDHILRNPEAEIPTGPFYIYGKQNNPDIKPWPYDIKKAAQLLDEAGWVDTDGDGIRDKDGLPLRFKFMISSGTELHENIAKLLKDSAAKVGIEVIPDPYEWSVFSKKVVDRDFDALNMAWGGGVESDPYQIWHSSQIENGSNYVGFNNPQADAIIEEARQTLDADKRNVLYHRFHQIIHQQQPYTFIYTRPEQRFLDKRFENVIIHKLGIDQLEWYVPKDVQRYK